MEISDDSYGNWESRVSPAANSVEVIGRNQYISMPNLLPRRPLTEREIYRRRIIATYGSETLRQLDNGTYDSTVLPVIAESGAARTDNSNLVTISDVASLGVKGGHITIQPSRGWGYVNKAVHLRSDATTITKKTTVLGEEVTITVSPASYTWHCGDKHSFTTKNAGGTWTQGNTVTHHYTHPGTYTLSATITWKASYTVNGKRYPVNGTLTTTSARQTIKIVEAEAVLTH